MTDTPTDTAALVARLRELAEKAEFPELSSFPQKGQYTNALINHLGKVGALEVAITDPPSVATARAELIETLVNALPQILSALSALSAPAPDGRAGGAVDVVGRAIRPFLVQAFLLGWQQSAEGYNAEYGALKSDIADKAEQECCDIDMPAARAAIAALPRRDGMREALKRVKQTLCVPAAEYVPAIRDCFDIIDAALKGEA